MESYLLFSYLLQSFQPGTNKKITMNIMFGHVSFFKALRGHRLRGTIGRIQGVNEPLVLFSGWGEYEM